MAIINKGVPCVDCLILPLCKNRPVIECSLLFDYFMTTTEPRRYGSVREVLGESYRLTKPGKIIAVRKIYNEEGESLWV